MLNFIFTKTPFVFLSQSLWRDEAFSFFIAKRNIFQIISLTIKDYNPPLYYLALHFWINIFGRSEVALRSLSLIFFWASIYVFFLFLEKILKLSFKKSLFYLLFFIINPLITYFAFEARMYSLLVLLGLLSFYSFYKKDFKLYFISTTLALYTHYFSLLIVLSQLFYIFFVYKQGQARKKIIKKMILPFVLFSPWFLIILVNKISLSLKSFWISKINYSYLYNFLGIIYTGYERGLNFYSDKIKWLSIFILLIIWYGLTQLKKMETNDKKIFTYLSIWAIGIPFFTVIFSFFYPIFLPRYLIFTNVGLLLLIIFTLERMGSFWKVFVIAVLLFQTINYQSLQIKKRKKSDIRKVIREIKVLSKKEDSLYVFSELDFFSAQYYFDENRVFIFGKSYQQIPNYVGKILIPKDKVETALPVYPKKAFILRRNGKYEIQSIF